jgi:uncharacterized protein YukE
MSEIMVVGGAIESMAGRLSGIAGEVDEYHGQLATHVSAAQDTAAHGTMSGLMARWAAALPEFADAGGRLHAAMHGAARAYTQSDDAVARAAAKRLPGSS